MTHHMSSGINTGGSSGEPISTSQAGITATQGPFAWDQASVLRCARAFLLVTVATFLLAVTIGVFLPNLPSRVLSVFETINLWAVTYLTSIVSLLLFILLSNIKSALIAALLGVGSVWVNARVNVRHTNDQMTARTRLVDRFAVAFARGIIGLGRRVFSEIGDERHEFAARTSAAIAALVPFLAVGINALVLGLWMAQGLLTGWLSGLAQVGELIMPHAPVELPALVLSASVGLWLAAQLVPTRAQHDSAWQLAKAKMLITSNQVAQSLALIIGLLAIAAALEVWGWV
ncbi:MAG: stage II sporulation protein M [Candidatus Zipacnadales bacterium]